MPAQFDLKTVELIEFGVGIDEDSGQRFVLVPIDSGVQAALREMVVATREEMKEAGERQKSPAIKSSRPFADNISLKFSWGRSAKRRPPFRTDGRPIDDADSDQALSYRIGAR